MTATYAEAALIKITFGPLTAPFPQNVSVPGLKVGDAVLTVVSASGSPVFGPGNASVEPIISVADNVRVIGILDDSGGYTAVLSRL